MSLFSNIIYGFDLKILITIISDLDAYYRPIHMMSTFVDFNNNIYISIKQWETFFFNNS